MKLAPPVDVPQNWKHQPFWTIAKRKRVADRPDLPLLSVYRDYGVVRKDSRDDNYNKPGSDLRSNQVVDIGDIVANKMKTWQGSIAVSNDHGIVSPAYMVFSRDETVHPRFLHYLLRSQPYIAQYGRLSYGVRIGQWDLRWEDMKDVRVLIPNQRLQVLIADFLDRETARIDALIDAKKRLIDLLAEKRTALITHAVTKGLDPSVPMKDSGIPWIGEIPAHWELTRLKNVAEVRSGLTLGARYDGSLVTVPYLRVANVQDGFLDLQDVTDISVPVDVATRHRLQTGDVLLLEGNGNPANLGRGAVWDGSITGCIHQNHIHAVRPYAGLLLSSFLAAVVKSTAARSFFATGSAQVSIASLSRSRLAELPIALPPESVQIGLMKQLDSFSVAVERAERTLQRQRDLLVEYRQALITAAVTGQMDEETLQVSKPAYEAMGVEVPS